MKETNISPKRKNIFKPLLRLIVYCKKNLLGIIIALICAVGGTVFTIIGPDKLKEMTNIIIDGLMTNIDLTQVCIIGFTLAFYYASSVILSYLQGFLMASVTQKVSKQMRTDISTKINKLPLRYFDSINKGDILSRVTNDVDTICQALNQSVCSLVSAVALLIGSIIMMFITNWIMAIAAILSSFIGFIIMAIIAMKSQKYFIQQQKLLGNINGFIEEIYSGHNIVKAYNAEKKLNSTFVKLNTELKNCNLKSQFLSGLMMPIMSFVGNLGYVAVCVTGALLVINGNISFGVIAAFIVYVRLFNQPLSQIGQSITSLQQSSAASGRVFEFLNEKEILDEKNKKTKLINAKGNILFKNVNFGYDENKIIINDFTAKIKAGQKVAIVGPTGAGKTTIVNLLMRFYELQEPKLILNKTITDNLIFNNGKSIKLMIDTNSNLFINGTKSDIKLNKEVLSKLPKNKLIKFDKDFNIIANNKKIKDITLDIITGKAINKKIKTNFGVAYYGDILIDNIPTKSITRDNLHKIFCMVLQDTWLFEGTIKQNIIYNKSDVTDNEIEEACKIVGVDHFIKTLPNGYDTLLNEDANFSSGQKQLLTIARAMINQAPVLILDEATSSVDTRTEILIQNAMDKLSYGKTSIIIAHRLSTIKNADLILVMKDGDIIESGKHNFLLKKKGFYSELYNSQFDKIN